MVGVNLRVLGEMVMALIVTVPSTVLVCFLALEATQLSDPAA